MMVQLGMNTKKRKYYILTGAKKAAIIITFNKNVINGAVIEEALFFKQTIL
jgi:hypothetical protein